MENLNIADFLKQANLNRNAAMLSLKFRTIRKNAFLFFRGTPELFYARMPANVPFIHAPATWICGDLHLENFGSYKGNDRQIYFDINDFDGGTLAPCLLDPFRMAASVLIAGEMLKCTRKQSEALAVSYLNAYFQHLAEGNIRMVSQDTQPEDIAKILRLLQPLKRRSFLEEMVRLNGNKKPAIQLENGKRQPLPKEQKFALMEALETWSTLQNDPAFFTPLDACFRVAGTGSLGMERFLVLIRGLDTSNGYRLLDIKETRPSFVPGALKPPGSESQRVAAVIRRTVAVPPALLGTFEWNDKSFLVREYRGSGENTPLSALIGKYKKTLDFLDLLGALTAWDHLRGSGKQGAVQADMLMELGDKAAVWVPEVMDAARAAAGQMQADFKSYGKAYDGGAFG